MSVLIFRLNGVDDDEAADVRQLLDDNGFPYHETGAGFLGLGTAGLWLLQAEHKREARALIDAYQQQRAARLSAEYRALCDAGRAETAWQRALQHPFRTAFHLAGIAAILYLMLVPFLTLGR
ncbi:hypothetical protein F2Q65_15205 [Thiohalocapsa marina]|uniref:DUF2007 domain-containing protein n=2 Tax=Thiohalocapsa marina TaxID=424902 RepID=A0A5M8FFK7_9GAMM|nr:DUF6164 family protein [Thiohalocapsa marina]KAA6183668.1 hypothetical protein F2Q65_15205 [Thiohalocapsa marina]